MMPLTMRQPSFPKWLGALVLLAFLIRALAAVSARAQWNEDRDLYLSIARQIVAGEGFSRQLSWVEAPDVEGERQSPAGEWWLVPEPGAVPVCRIQSTVKEWRPVSGESAYPTAYRPPLYPCVVALMMWLTGGVWGVIAFQVMCGVLTVVLVVMAAYRSGLGEFSLVSGLIVALDPLLVSYTPNVMTETTSAGLVAFLLWSTSLCRERWRPVVGGACLGLCALCRPTFLASGLIWGPLWWFSTLGAGRSVSLRGLLLVPCTMALVVAPWAIRNRVVLGDWIPSTTHGGYTLRLAHNPGYDEWLTGDRRHPFDGERFARSAVPLIGIDLLGHLEREVDNAHSTAAWNHIWEHPQEACSSAWSLWKRFWGPIPDSQSNAPVWLRSGLVLHWLIVGITALAGFRGISGEARSSLWSLSLALLGSFTAVHALYWADARMRAPLIPVLALLSAHGVYWLSGRRESFRIAQQGLLPVDQRNNR